jgi:radical SAM superfamily enzyme YgiQ (UPF0313 family)
MKDTLFVQFITKAKLDNMGREVSFDTDFTQMSPDDKYYLGNGFSYVYDQCREAGDFYWCMTGSKDTLPISEGKVYVSAFFPYQVLQALFLAAKSPNVKFMIGGPVINPYSSYGVYEPVPKNVEFRSGLAEKEIFNSDKINTKWDLEPPKNLGSNYITSSYVTGRGCYWGRCIFCELSQHKEQRGEYKAFFNDLRLPDGYKNTIWLTADSSPVYSIQKLPKLSHLPNLDYLKMYLRADLQTINALPDALRAMSKDNGFICIVGVEFPSDRMLRLMNKGTTVDLIKKLIDTLGLCRQFRNFHCLLTFILGWSILSEEDLKCLEEFLIFLKDYDYISAAIYGLHYGFGVATPKLVKINNPNYRRLENYRFELDDGLRFKSFFFVPVLTEEEKKLNGLAYKLFLKSGAYLKDTRFYPRSTGDWITL